MASATSVTLRPRLRSSAVEPGLVEHRRHASVRDRGAIERDAARGQEGFGRHEHFRERCVDLRSAVVAREAADRHP